MKYLLVTSDDFGMTLSVNRGIEEAMLRGVVGATNVMVPCPWFSDAVLRVKEHALPVGIHLTLTCEWDLYRWRPLTDALTLRTLDGGMPVSFEAFSDLLSETEIRAEFDAQLRELRRRGIEPTHVDTHMIASQSNSATELKVKSVVRELCAREGLIYTYDRNPDGSLRYFSSETLFSPLETADLKERLGQLNQGIHHVISHCAIPGDDLDAVCSEDSPARPWAREYRVKDYETLTDSGFRKFIDEQGFTLLDMHEFLRLKKE